MFALDTSDESRVIGGRSYFRFSSEKSFQQWRSKWGSTRTGKWEGPGWYCVEAEAHTCHPACGPSFTHYLASVEVALRKLREEADNLREKADKIDEQRKRLVAEFGFDVEP